MPDGRRLREQIELGRRLMPWLSTAKDRETFSAYVAELEAKLRQTEDDEDDEDC
jgi:hypothetical protein